MHKNICVFLDRDGVINENRSDHVKSWSEFVFLPEVFEPLRLLATNGMRVIVTTNQAVINRGLVTAETVEEINRGMAGVVAQNGGRIDAIYYCPHRPEENCGCRKPRPGLLLRAAQEWNINLAASYMIGDALSDIDAALAAGCQAILVRTGSGRENEPVVREKWPHVPIVNNLRDAVAWILENIRSKLENGKGKVEEERDPFSIVYSPSSVIRALVLAAGEGTRLRPLTLDRPKPMLPVAGRPVLEHIVHWLRAHGITKIAINLHHKPQAITDYFGNGRHFGVQVIYSFEESLLGTAGAARKLKDFLQGTFLVVYGDVLTNLNLTTLLEFHRHKQGAITMALYRVDNPSACGLVGLDKNSRIIRFVEKPPPEEVFTNMANAGVLVVESGVLSHVPPNTFYDFGHNLLPDLLAKGVPLYGYPIPETAYLIDIGTPESYWRAQQEWVRVQGRGSAF